MALSFTTCFNSNFTLMATTAKRGRPAKTAEAAAPKAAPAAPKQQKKESLRNTSKGPIHHEYDPYDAQWDVLFMKAGPVSVYDEETDTIRAIRYIQEDSIYVDEQTSKPKEEANYL